MKNLPEVTDEVAIIIREWADLGGTLNSKKIAILKDFYSSLGVKWNSKTTMYRGLTLSSLGFEKMMFSGKIKLIKRSTESWTCEFNIARRFYNYQDYAVILAKKIPKKSVIIDLNAIYELYRPMMLDKTSSENFMDMMNRLHHYNECEILTETLCTSCEIKDLIRIRFAYVNNKREDSRSSTIELISEFARKNKVDKSVEHFINTGKLLVSRFGYRNAIAEMKLTKSNSNVWLLTD